MLKRLQTCRGFRDQHSRRSTQQLLPGFIREYDFAGSDAACFVCERTDLDTGISCEQGLDDSCTHEQDKRRARRGLGLSVTGASQCLHRASVSLA